MSDNLLPINGKSVIEYATVKEKELKYDLINRIITVIEETIRDNAELGIIQTRVGFAAWENEIDKKLYSVLPDDIVCEIKNYFNNKYFFVKYYLQDFFVNPQMPKVKEKKYKTEKIL